jgi:sec-independent protein translocase protein TatA
MGTFSIWHWLIVLAVVLVLFGGGGKIPKLMRDMGQGINAFKKGLKEEDKDKAKGKADSEPQKPIEDDSSVAARVEEKDKAASG